MKIHEMKCHPNSFGPLAKGQKHLELRVDDRDEHYETGDVLYQREWDPETDEYTGRHKLARVTHLIRAGEEFGQGLQEGYVAMSVRIFREPRSI